MQGEEAVDLVHPCLPEAGEVNVMKIKEPFLPGVPERLRQAHMDVRVPFQVPAESVDGGDEAGDADALYVPEKVRAVLFPVELSAVLVFQPLVIPFCPPTILLI